MTTDNPLALILGLALAGLGLGFGLVIGAFVARALRRYMHEEDLRPYGRRDGRHDDPDR